MNIENAKYVIDVATGEDNQTIKATIDGAEMFIPVAEGNRHYQEIKAQVDAGTLTIAEADPLPSEEVSP